MDSARSPSRTDETIVVFPCFNEARRLSVPSYHDFLRASPNVTFVFVDDGSTDDTPLVLEKLRQQYPRQVCTLRLNSNVGKGEAVRRGMRAALRRQAAFVGYWDADLATPLDTICRFADLLRTRPQLELVMGSRVALLGRDIQRNPLRHVAGRAFATAASIVLRLPVYDTQCGAKLFRATESLRTLIAHPFRARWIFDVEILARMMQRAREKQDGQVRTGIYEYPLEEWRDVQGSTLTVSDFIIAAIDLAAIYWHDQRKTRRRQIVALQPASNESFVSQNQAA
jgi:glycosyltransferase involved in cell wall biosynthesis